MKELKETLQKISELDDSVIFFIQHFNELNNETSCEWIPCLYYSNSIAIEFETNSINYRIYDPFNQITNNYKHSNGYTDWSLGDPFEQQNKEGEDE